jgi:hypothetical protein
MKLNFVPSCTVVLHEKGGRSKKRPASPIANIPFGEKHLLFFSHYMGCGGVQVSQKREILVRRHYKKAKNGQFRLQHTGMSKSH